MKLNEKIKITEERLNGDERSYERMIMGFLVGSYKAAPGYRMETLSSRETGYDVFAVEVNVYMPRKKAAYATFYIELNSMNIQLAGTQDEPKMIYYRGSVEEYKENEYKAYCAAADFMVRMEQSAPETETPDAPQEAANDEMKWRLSTQRRQSWELLCERQCAGAMPRHVRRNGNSMIKRMAYRVYKKSYADCQTIPGSYDVAKRTIEVILPDTQRTHERFSSREWSVEGGKHFLRGYHIVVQQWNTGAEANFRIEAFPPEGTLEEQVRCFFNGGTPDGYICRHIPGYGPTARDEAIRQARELAATGLYTA